jgi:hypothetical protein
MRLRSLACALLVLCSCGPGDGPAADEPATAAAPQAPAAQPAPVPAPEAVDPDEPVAGLWWVFSPSFPIRAFRASLEPGHDDDERGGTWVSFDWRGTTEEQSLQRRSKPVRITARSSGSQLVIEGPSPMLTESGKPNGQSGHWRLALRRAELPGETPRWSGVAVHDGGLTGPEGVPVEMERAFRRWQ